MNLLFTFFLSQSILLPILIAFLRLRKSFDLQFLPFIILLGIAFISEISSFLLVDIYHKSNAISTNIYSLLECLILLYQFYLWGSVKHKKTLFICLALLTSGVWIMDHLIYQHLFSFRPYFRIFYAFIIVLLSINTINAMIVQYKGNLFRNTRFLLSMGFMIFFIYQIIYEASFYIGYDKSLIAGKIILFFGYLNFFVNVIFAAAVYFIPSRET